MSMDQREVDFLSQLKFNEAGLIVAIAQDNKSKQVLMQAYMNKESIVQSLKTRRVTYFSRSRNTLWTKGDSSGNWQKLLKIQADCDGDSLLLTVEQHGPACHTKSESCYLAGSEIEIKNDSL